MSTPANRRRALERKVCREELSNHLKESLGLRVHPSEVRLHPIEKDQYRWVFEDNNSHLFDKHLSDLSTNLYIELRREVRNGNICAALSEMMPEPSQEGINTKTSIRKLEEDIKRAREINKGLQEEIHNLRNREACLRSQNNRLRKVVSHLTKKATTFGQALAQAELQTQKSLNIMNALYRETKSLENLESHLDQSR